MSDNQHHVAHPTNRQYVQIAIILAVITAIEVAIFYLNEAFGLGAFEAPLLIILSTLKFVMVIGWFMHLRFEKGMLSRFFGAGFILAMGLYAVMLAAMGIMVIRG